MPTGLLWIDKATGKQFIEKIAQGSTNALCDFYNARRLSMRGSPLIHDGLITYGIFRDLGYLKPDVRVALLPTAFDIVLNEEDKAFGAAIHLLSTVIGSDRRLEGVDVDVSRCMYTLKERKDRIDQSDVYAPYLNSVWNELLEVSKLLRPADGAPWGNEQVKILNAGPVV